MKRKLSDFQNLTAAEEKLRDELSSGDWVRIGTDCPAAGAGPERQVRAEFLRYLILGARDGLPGQVTEKGVQLRGALITGVLDLEGADIGTDLWLFDCHFKAPPILRSASLGTLGLDGSHLPGLKADRLEAKGSVFLRGIHNEGEIRLLGAKLGGDLSCTGARLTAGENGRALNADRLDAKGGCILEGIRSQGEIRFLGAMLGGGLDCEGARLEAGDTGRALNADGADISGVFFLRKGAEIQGDLDLTGAQIGILSDTEECWPAKGNLLLERCRYGAITGGPVDAEARIRWLCLQTPERFKQDFWPQPWEHCAKVLREMGHRDEARKILIDKEQRQRAWQRDKLKARIEGAHLRLRLERAEKEDPAQLNEDLQATLSKHRGPMFAEVDRQLDGATYFADRALAEKIPDRDAFEKDHAPILSRARAVGFDPALIARGVLLETRVKLCWLALKDFVLRSTISYGHRPFRAVNLLIGMWLLGALLFGIAAGQDAIKPNNPFVLRSAEWVACEPGYEREHDGQPASRREDPGQSQLECFRDQPEAAGYPQFNALIYSADTLLPIVAMEMQEYWIPDESQGTRGRATRVFLWLQIAIGWALSLLAVAGFSGLIRSD